MGIRSNGPLTADNLRIVHSGSYALLGGAALIRNVMVYRNGRGVGASNAEISHVRVLENGGESGIAQDAVLGPVTVNFARATDVTAMYGTSSPTSNLRVERRALSCPPRTRTPSTPPRDDLAPPRDPPHPRRT